MLDRVKAVVENGSDSDENPALIRGVLTAG
jgi:hypothetical protein